MLTRRGPISVPLRIALMPMLMGLIATSTAWAVPSYTIIALGTPPGGIYSEGRAINDNGQVTGISRTSSGEERAFLYNHGTMIDLGTLGGNVSEGWGINDSGQVTGGSFTSGGAYRAFLYEDGTMYDLNHLVTNLTSAGFFSLNAGYGINNHEQIVGYGQATNGNYIAFLATPNMPTLSVSLPSSAALLSLGLVVLGITGRRRSRRQL